MRKNKYDEREQEFRTLCRRQEKINKIQSESCWVEYEVPEPNGWRIRMGLRDDVARRGDAHTLLEVIELIEVPIWMKDKDTGRRSHNACIHTGKKKWEELYPWRNHQGALRYGIGHKAYLSLSTEAKKWFNSHYDFGPWGGAFFYCNVPENFWVRKLEKSYATHYQVLDTDLESEDAWIDDRLESKFIEKSWKAHDRVPNSYRKCDNRSVRAKNKNALRRLEQYNYDEGMVEFQGKPKDLTWFFW